MSIETKLKVDDTNQLVFFLGANHTLLNVNNIVLNHDVANLIELILREIQPLHSRIYLKEVHRIHMSLRTP